MANNYFTPTGTPANNSDAISATMRSEFARVQAAFDKVGPLTANRLLRVNPSADAWAMDCKYQDSTITSATMSFTIPGDLSVSSSTASGAFYRLGPLCAMQFNCQFVYTQTTASGALRVQFPQVTQSSFYGSVSMIYFNGPSTFTDPVLASFIFVGGVASLQFLRQILSTATIDDFEAGDLPSGTLTISGVVYGAFVAAQ